MSRRVLRSGIVVALAVAALSSCAYYNTFYLARKNYMLATGGLPYAVDKHSTVTGSVAGITAGSVPQYNKAVDFSKKVLGVHPKSKWVDDAYLLWARSLIGKDDPQQALTLLSDFALRYPDSPLKSDAMFYRGVALRHTRKYLESATVLLEFVETWPKHEMAPYAYLERARALIPLERPAEAAEAATVLLERWPNHLLRDRALVARADARLAARDTERARADYRELGTRAGTDDERFAYLLKEVDCLEAGRDFPGALNLLRGAIAFEIEPVLSDTSGRPSAMPTGVGAPRIGERWGRLRMRIGTVHALMGEAPPALEAYEDVIAHYYRQPLGAEAQYRIGYVYETVADDFDRAREEYAKVRQQSPSSAFVAQAASREGQLQRLSQFRAAGGDSTMRQAEAALMRAELYLFQLDKPDRALEEYEKLAVDLKGTPWEAKALAARAWVLRTKFNERQRADSLWWVVVREHPATEAQLAARDYLEAGGIMVPDSLIKLPEAPLVPDSAARLLASPAPVDPRAMGADSLLQLGMRSTLFGGQSSARPPARPGPPDSLRGPGSRPPDSLATRPGAPAVVTDSLRRVPDPIPSPLPSDTTSRVPAPPPIDTTRTPPPLPPTPSPKDTLPR